MARNDFESRRISRKEATMHVPELATARHAPSPFFGDRALGLSRLDRALVEIAPEESRVLQRVADPSLEANRWFKIMQNAEVGRRDLFRWANRPSLVERPTAEHHSCGYRGVKSVPVPILEFRGSAENHLDLYTAGDGFFASERLLDVLLSRDSESIEWVEADVSGAKQRYFYCLCTRSLKAIDEETTTLVLGPGRVVAFKDDFFAIDNDEVPPNTHCFVLYYRVGPLWSRELVDAVTQSGATGLVMWPPFVSPLSNHAIRI